MNLLVRKYEIIIYLFELKYTLTHVCFYVYFHVSSNHLCTYSAHSFIRNIQIKYQDCYHINILNYIIISLKIKIFRQAGNSLFLVLSKH